MFPIFFTTNKSHRLLWLKHKYAESIFEEGTNLNPVILFRLPTMYSVTRLFQYVRKVLYPQEEFIRNTSVNNLPARDTGSFPDYLFTERLGNLWGVCTLGLLHIHRISCSFEIMSYVEFCGIDAQTIIGHTGLYT